MADEKNIENKDENVIEVEEVEKIDVEEKVADEKVEADESEAKTDSVDYEVYLEISLKILNQNSQNLIKQ